MRPVRFVLSFAAVGLCLGFAASAPATAQQSPSQGATGHAGMPGGAMNPAMAGMHSAHQRMDQRMRQAMQGIGGDAERAFAEMMVPHHEGAVEMAQAAMQGIRDPELRRMAEKTMRENQEEAEELRAWLQRHR